MAITLVQKKVGGGPAFSANPSLTFPSPATAGNLLVATLATTDPLASVSPPSGFSLQASKDDGGTSSGTEFVLVASKIAVGGETAIAWVDSNGTNWEGVILEFAQAGATKDGSSTNFTGTSTSGQAGSVTPGAANGVFVAIAGLNGSMTFPSWDSSFVDTDTVPNMTQTMVAYKIKTDALAENPTASWGFARRACIALVSFPFVAPVAARSPVIVGPSQAVHRASRW